MEGEKARAVGIDSDLTVWVSGSNIGPIVKETGTKGANICMSECSMIVKDLANKKEKGVCEQKRSDCERFVLLESKRGWPMQCHQTSKTHWSGTHHEYCNSCLGSFVIMPMAVDPRWAQLQAVLPCHQC